MTRIRPPGARTASSPAEWLDQRPHAVTWAMLRAEFSLHAVTRDVAAGRIARLLPGTYVATKHRDTFAARAAAALLWAGPTAMLGGTSAAHSHGAVAEAPVVVTLCVPRTARLRGPEWIRVIQPTVAGPAVSLSGLRAVPVPDAILQSWAELGAGPGAALVVNAIRRGSISAGALAQRAAEYPRLRERQRLDRLLAPLSAGIESYLELLAATRVFNTAEFSGLQRQQTVRSGGRSYRLDLLDRVAQVAVELDGRAFHADDAARRRDMARDADLAALGILTIRLTFEDVTGRPEWCRQRVRAAMAARRVRRAA